MIDYIQQNHGLIKNRPQCFRHGDFNVHNMMIENGKPIIIDFDYDFGDPWQEFESIRWSVDVSLAFATGMINGYFNNRPPEQFWKVLLLYFSAGMFHNLLWGAARGQAHIDSALRHIKDVFSWTDNMQNPVPAWYREYV